MTGVSMLRRSGVIAAGRGQRLAAGDPGVLKPLVVVSGRPLIERVLTSIGETGTAQVCVIINDASVGVREAVTARSWPFALRWIVETTPSSMHSFLRVVEALAADGDAGPFLISTVDTVATAGVYRAFVAAAVHGDADVVLAVNRPQPDDAPLLVAVDEAPASGTSQVRRVLAIGEGAGDGRSGQTIYATAGFYLVRASVLAEADGARRDGLTALRLFLARLLARGFHVAAVPVADSIDVDRPEDVAAAEDFLRSAHA